MKKKSEIIITILLLTIIASWIVVYKGEHPVSPANKTTTQENNFSSSITITKEKIKEDNFTGTLPVIVGQGVLADSARAYIASTVADFKQQANEDVPAMRIQFGADAPTATYEIDINATYVKSSKTDSIIIDIYAYTGGANGKSSYKVFTVSFNSGKILSLSDVVKADKQEAFTAFVKNKLLAWKPDGSDGPAVFPDQVNALTFSSFANWSFDDGNLIIYFNKYDIGPGVLGAVDFPLPLSLIQGYLVADY